MITQFVPQEICLKCKGCCRFNQAITVWAPGLLDAEIKILSKGAHLSTLVSKDKKILLLPDEREGIFLCPFFDNKENKCKVYSLHPFDCQLYPFLINLRNGKTYLAVDLNCRFAKDNFRTSRFEKYCEYLTGLLSGKDYRDILKNNPQVIQTYQGVTELKELTI